MELTKKLKLTLTGLMFIILATAFVAEARPFGHRFGGHDTRPVEPFGLKNFLELKLSESQQEKMIKIENKYSDKKKEFRKKIMESGKNLSKVLEADQFNEENVRKALRAVSAVREDMFLTRLKMMNEMKTVLNDKQLDLLKKRKTQRLERFQNFHAAWLETLAE